MAFTIKDADTARLARELAAATGESITVATRRAIEERLARTRAGVDPEHGPDDLLAIIERGRSRPTLDDRPVEEILS